MRDTHRSYPTPASRAALTVLLHPSIDHTVQKHLTETQTCTCVDTKAHRHCPALPRSRTPTLAALPAPPQGTVCPPYPQRMDKAGSWRQPTHALTQCSPRPRLCSGKAMPCTPLPTHKDYIHAARTGTVMQAQPSHLLGQQSHYQESTTVYLRAWHPPKPSTLGCCLTWASRGGWGASLPREPPKLSPDYSGF